MIEVAVCGILTGGILTGGILICHPIQCVQTYRDIIHGKNILIKAFIQSFTPKNWQKTHRRNWTVNHQRLPWKQEACPVNVHKSCDTVTMNVNKDRRRGFGPRTPHSSCFQGWATQNSGILSNTVQKKGRERGGKKSVTKT